MKFSLLAAIIAVPLCIASLGVLFGRMSFNTTIAVNRFNERAISTLCIGFTYFIAYALLRATVLSFFGVSAEYIASEHIYPELALAVTILAWPVWKTHCFIREKNMNISFQGSVPKIWISSR